MKNHYQPCFFMANFARNSAQRKTQLFLFRKYKNEWLNHRVPIDDQNQKSGLYSKNLEGIYTELERSFRNNFLNLILSENKNRVLNSKESKLIVQYIAETISRHIENYLKLTIRTLKLKNSIKNSKKDFYNEPILTCAHIMYQMMIQSSLRYDLKVFNDDTKSLICPDVTCIAARRVDKELAYHIIPISYNKVIIGSLPQDNIYLEELTIDIINDLSFQSSSKILLCDQKMTNGISDQSILKYYSVSEFIK